MTTHYTHLTIEERVTLMIMRMQGASLRAIAQVLGRQPSTLSREVRRQSQPGHYDASTAGARARALRHVPRRSKILALVLNCSRSYTACWPRAGLLSKLPPDSRTTGLIILSGM